MTVARMLIMAFLFVALVSGSHAHASSNEYNCDEDIFTLDPEIIAKWKLELPVEENSVLFPLVFYRLFDTVHVFPFEYLPEGNQMNVQYLGCTVVDEDWHARLACSQDTVNYEHHYSSYVDFIDDYNKARPKEGSFEEKKKFFEQHLLRPGRRVSNTYIMGIPGEKPDEQFIPIVDPQVVECSRKARVKNMLSTKRLHDPNFSIYRPVNLKPGMRVLVPEPPQDSDEPTMPEDTDADEQ